MFFTILIKIFYFLYKIVFPFIFIDGKKYDTLTTDDNEVGILSADGTWFIPLQELTINEMKGLKSLMAEN